MQRLEGIDHKEDLHVESFVVRSQKRQASRKIFNVIFVLTEALHCQGPDLPFHRNSQSSGPSDLKLCVAHASIGQFVQPLSLHDKWSRSDGSSLFVAHRDDLSAAFKEVATRTFCCTAV